MNQRVRLDGKFLQAAGDRFFVRGVTYGTFAPNEAGEPFPEPEATRRDLDLIRELGANTLRVYDVPPPWLLDAAATRDLRLFVSVPWREQSCFLDSRTRRREIRTTVTAAVQSLGGHPALLAVSVGNEIPPDIVRWSGTRRVAAFLDDLVDAVHQADPDCLCTYASYPPTEFLQPDRLDFLTFNLFLHSPGAFTPYLHRLHQIAGDKPLVLGECGIDTLREGAAQQADVLAWTLELAARAGLAGAIIFSFTDDWVRGGMRVTDWAMGLTTAQREPKPAFAVVQARFRSLAGPSRVALPQITAPSATAPATTRPASDRPPRVSIVVASHNGAATLPACLEAALTQSYPDFEVIVVDDGSTDDTPEITARYSSVRTLRVPRNIGLSNARNLGIRAATGDIIAFADADCRPDQEWLHYLVLAMLEPGVAGAGGPNLLPPEDPPLAAVVYAAPGGPIHVLLDARTAEHLPGCNMAFWRWALDAIGGFDPAFHSAGDDVDLCWRLQRRGWRLAFAPAGFVWHHRRSTLAAFLRQQAGYGEAEALLQGKHPTHFNALGGARWQGNLGTQSAVHRGWRSPFIFRGPFATGLFQTIYTPPATGFPALLLSPEYHVLIVLPLVILSFIFPRLWPVTGVAAIIPPIVAVFASLPVVLVRDRRRWWSRPLLAVLTYLQPLARGIARYATRLGLQTQEPQTGPTLEAESQLYQAPNLRERAYWSAHWKDRQEWVERIASELERRDWGLRRDSGWSDFDLEVPGSRWVRLQLTTAAEANQDHSQILRCRLRPHWTLTAHLTVWGCLGLVLAIAGIFEVNWRGWWIPPVTLIGLSTFIRHQGRRLQARLAVILDEVARDWALAPLDPASSPPPTEPST